MYMTTLPRSRSVHSPPTFTRPPARAAAIAGNMHVDSFVPHEALDPLDLPASLGGLAYLGRVSLHPIDDGSNRTVLAECADLT
jgi:hypothetical protein